MEATDVIEEKKKTTTTNNNDLDLGSSSQDHDQDPDDISLKPIVMIGKSKLGTDDDDKLKPSSSRHKNDKLLESAKAEMGDVIEENKRLRSDLDRIMKDYHALQLRFHEIASAHESKNSTSQDEQQQKNTTSTSQQSKEVVDAAGDQLSLSLGRNSSIDSKNKMIFTNTADNLETERKEEGTGLALALYYKHDQEHGAMPNSGTDNNSFDGPKETQTPSKEVILIPAGGGGDDDEGVQQPPIKKARVSVRARCDAPTMNDGCQWRKYGQKIAKGNPCPRAYYRCTVAPSCPVRKQVQRCVDDMSILITTYEGTHNHQLPISANPMATTTSAAAYMLMSGSSTSNDGLGSEYSSATTNSHSNSMLNDLSTTLNFIADVTRSRPPSLLSSNSFSTYASSQPTITLDLTSSTSSSPSTSSFTSSTFAPRSSYTSYPIFTNLTFNSADLSNNLNPRVLNWPSNEHLDNGQVGQTPPSMTIGARPAGPSNQDSLFYQTLLQNIRNPSTNPSHSDSQPPLDSTVDAAARAVTSDPTFQSFLTAALSSRITGSSSSGSGGDSSSTALTQNQLQK